MAFTLEAALVIPITMFLTVSIISSSINLYDEIETESHVESGSLLYVMENDEIWSCKTYDDGTLKWSKRIAVNPVKIKSFLEFAFDSAEEIREFFPAFKGMEALFLENTKQ